MLTSGICYTMRMMREAVLVCTLALVALAFWASPVQAASLQEVELVPAQYYLDVRLGFDSKAKYSESFRYDPDRFLLTFTGCTLTVPAAQREALAEIDHHLLTRISLYQNGPNLQLGFYLNQPVKPFIRYDEHNYYLRFYTATRSERVTQLATGVSLIEKTSVYQGCNFQMYLVRVDSGASVSLYTAGADRYDGKTRRRAPSSFGRRENALVVINGGFFGQAGEHLSTFVEDGVIRATGVYPTRPMLVVTEAGQVDIGRYSVDTALIAGSIRIPVAAKNYPYENGRVFVYNHRYPIEELPQHGMYYYLLEDGKLRYYSASTSGLWLAPEVLLIACDILPEVNPLRQIPDGAAVQLETRITNAAGQTVLAHSAIGGAPMLVENGAIEISVAADRVRADIARSERSRTAVALSRSGQLLLAVVKEMESAGYGGVTLTALAQLLIDEGAYTAMNLDGGGSSAIVVAGQLLNLSEAQERPVTNVVVLTEAASALDTTPQDAKAEPQPAILKYNKNP